MQRQRINHRHLLSQAQQSTEAGFTLIELMVAMSMGLIMLLGMMMMFTSNAKVASTLASRTERLGDLYLASQIVQGQLRNAQSGSISWASNVLTYTDQDGDLGYFEYKRTSNDRLYWRRPTFLNYEEMIRDLHASTGMTVTSSGSPATWQITLKSSFKDEDRQDKTMQISFKVWARN
ncbi:MAG: prepilin-type N-terminal cleavage/methylation domain-containing protein [Mariprofundaceae bacterium]